MEEDEDIRMDFDSIEPINSVYLLLYILDEFFHNLDEKFHKFGFKHSYDGLNLS